MYLYVNDDNSKEENSFQLKKVKLEASAHSKDETTCQNQSLITHIRFQ